MNFQQIKISVINYNMTFFHGISLNSEEFEEREKGEGLAEKILGP